MDWQPGGDSSDVEDRRDSSGGGGGGGGFGFGGGGGGGIGLIGFVVLLVISLVTGHNFLGSVLGGGGSSQGSGYSSGPQGGQDGSQSAYGSSNGGAPQPHPAGEDMDVQLITDVLNDVQKTWTGIFQQAGKDYSHTKVVIYRGETYSGCGDAQSQTGPFYCPEDHKVYIDLSFWDELKKFGGSTADFAQAYVLAHELGHHVQNLLGIEAKEQRLVQQNPGQRNQYSVDLELQADCFAGVWAHSASQRGKVHPSDIPAGLSAAAAVGDDHLQQTSGRAVSPESWTHGSSAQRQMWFKRGLDGGTIQSCDTFGAGAGNEGGGDY